MHDTEQQNEDYDDLEAKRERLRELLNEIVHAVSEGMREAGLDFPIYMTVPNSGESLVGIATPLDPSDEDWGRTLAVVCQIIEQRIGSGKLWHRPLRCAVANGAISAADVTDG